jgi:hypothetical protein
MWEAYIEGQNVKWTGREADMPGMSSGMHFHQPDDDTIHAEGRSNRLRLGTLLAGLGGEIADDKLVIPDSQKMAGTYASNDTTRLRVFVMPDGAEWSEVSDSFADVSFEDRMRILVTYGDLTSEEIAREQASVKAPEPKATPTDPTPSA